jgi:hypothetical protein
MNMMRVDSHSDNQYAGVLTMEQEIEWILIRDAADIADMHIESIRRLCRSGDIKCRQLIKGASAWEVDKASLIAYLNSDKNVGGRPRKIKS